MSDEGGVDVTMVAAEGESERRKGVHMSRVEKKVECVRSGSVKQDWGVLRIVKKVRED